jgi:miniconductance mechanosensitive channel
MRGVGYTPEKQRKQDVEILSFQLIQKMATFLEQWIANFLSEAGVSAEWSAYLRVLLLLALFSIAAGIIFWVSRRLVRGWLHQLVKKTPFSWDDLLAEHRVFDSIAHVIPTILLRISAAYIFRDFEALLPYIIKITDAYLVLLGMNLVVSIVRVIELNLADSELFKDKPLASYFQLLRILIYMATGFIILSIMMESSPFVLLGALGTMTAIVLLIFKDTILGLVASVQISSNQMVRVGDWIEMPKYNADGEVIAINLHTVKVQNWDRTITMVPTHFFIADSFKNWRGMYESGARRIKRSLFLNAQTVRFVDAPTRERFKRYQLIADFITERQHEIEQYNKAHQIDTSVLINGRRMTNLGVFRKYVEYYLQRHPKVRKDMHLVVRQLATEGKGIPIEIYCYVTETALEQYEAIQSDIFDHLYAVIAFFELDIYQHPSGQDITGAVKMISAAPASFHPDF